MGGLKKAAASLAGRLRRKKMFWRILSLYLAGSILLLSVFAAVLTFYLTQRALSDAVRRSRDSLAQAYAAADFALNTTYNTYFHLYSSFEASSLMLDDSVPTQEHALAVNSLLQSVSANGVVDSVYLVNCRQDRVYTSTGLIDTQDGFFDAQAMRLFQFYNESSNTLFLPRTLTYTDELGASVTRHFITLIFSRRSALMEPLGGMIVNIDETKLIELITRDLETQGDLYIISENGSILANADASLVNTSIYGSELWEQMQAHSGEEVFSFQVQAEGEDCLITGLNAARLRFCFLRITPVARLTESASYIRNVILVCAAAFLAIALVMSMVASRFIYHPLSRLVTSLRREAPAGPGGRQEGEEPAHASLDEMSFLDAAYHRLSSEVKSLSHDNQLLGQARQREVLLHLLGGEYASEEKCRREAEAVSLPTDGFFLAIVFLFDNFQALSQGKNAQDLALYRYALSNIAEELLAPLGPSFCVEPANDQVALVLRAESAQELGTARIRPALEKVNEAMSEHLRCTVSSGIGSAADGLLELVVSYNRAMSATGYRQVLGRGSVISYAEIVLRQSISPEYPMEADAQMVQALHSRSEDKAREGMDAFFSGLALANIDTINMAVTQLSISLSRTVHSMAAGYEGTRELPNYRLLSASLASCDTLEERKSILLDYCLQVIRIRSNELLTRRENLVERIKEFIETNYANPMLNTDDIAAFAELSPNYVRTVFKNSVGLSPADYLTQRRMEHAKELLATTDISTKEIAAAVGYYNHRYFYSVFKAKTGQTATMYRSAQRGSAAPEEDEHEKA